jgi:CPA1 family monovalent cation:H+ antiporter
MPLWLILGFVLAGIGAGTLAPGRFEHAFGTATLYVFLPALLFEAAWNLNARELRAYWRPVFALAVPGVFITTAVVAGAVRITGLPWESALLIGAMISATDPIAIVATFKRMPVPDALGTIVQSESLLNDAMAVVVYRTILATVVLGSGARAAEIAGVQALAGILGALALGIAVAYVLAIVAVRRHDAAVQIVATIVGAYLVYFGAETLHLSAIFAVIAFGIALREFERRFMEVAVATVVERCWDAMALGSNAVVFFLTGAALEIARIATAPVVAIAALAGIAVARAILAYGLTPLALRGSVPPGWLHVIRSAGARGALALALALALPAATAMRSTIIDVTFTLVLATLLASAITVPRAVRSVQAEALSD